MTSSATSSSAVQHPQITGPSKGVVGMVCLIIAESAIFTIFVVAYLFYLGKSVNGPQPKDVLDMPSLNSVCLLGSSATITFALWALLRGARALFSVWWAVTIALGGYFLYGTGLEWKELIQVHGLTIQTNLFGTTFYSLVGLHAFHVIVGLVMLMIVFLLSLGGGIRQEHHWRLEILALYWHFVDVIWIIVFTVVYLIGR